MIETGIQFSVFVKTTETTQNQTERNSIEFNGPHTIMSY